MTLKLFTLLSGLLQPLQVAIRFKEAPQSGTIIILDHED